MFVRMITYRQAQMKIVDTRVRLLSEVGVPFGYTAWLKKWIPW